MKNTIHRTQVMFKLSHRTIIQPVIGLNLLDHFTWQSVKLSCVVSHTISEHLYEVHMLIPSSSPVCSTLNLSSQILVHGDTKALCHSLQICQLHTHDEYLVFHHIPGSSSGLKSTECGCHLGSVSSLPCSRKPVGEDLHSVTHSTADKKLVK